MLIRHQNLAGDTLSCVAEYCSPQPQNIFTEFFLGQLFFLLTENFVEGAEGKFWLVLGASLTVNGKWSISPYLIYAERKIEHNNYISSHIYIAIDTGGTD